MNLKCPYSTQYTPPAPVLEIQLAAPGESPLIGPINAVVDSGSDGTLIPGRYLEAVEAIGIGEALLYGVLGDVRSVDLYEVDIQLGAHVLPGVVAIYDEMGGEVILGRNVLNKLILVLDGPGNETVILDKRPQTLR
jgi:hypothetical protein